MTAPNPNTPQNQPPSVCPNSGPQSQPPPNGKTRPHESGFPVRPIMRASMAERGYTNDKMVKHRTSRRAFFHDYCEPGYYMITATTVPGSPPLSVIPDIPIENLRKGELIIPNHTPLGILVKNEITDIQKHHPEIRVIRFVVMPDHIHIVINVQSRLKRMLGRELAGFFGACSKHHSQILKDSGIKTLFQPFHDRIIYNLQQLDRAIRYVEDNPRRLILKRKYPDLFRRYLHLSLAEHEYAAYGNIFLLHEIYLLPVRIHRRWSEAEFRKYHEDSIREIEKGAIAISPAIHPAEREIMNAAIEMGSSVIQLTDQGFEDRFKPKGRKFELCAEGRLLLLAPWPENAGRKSTAGYTEFHKMNDLALAISRLPADARLAIKRPAR